MLIEELGVEHGASKKGFAIQLLAKELDELVFESILADLEELEMTKIEIKGLKEQEAIVGK
jgi:hypothetical protein